MRLTILLLFAVASAHEIRVWNLLPTPFSVQFYSEGSSVNVELPPISNPPNPWILSGLNSTYGFYIGTRNFAATITPTNPQVDPPTMTVVGSFAWSPVNPNMTMQVSPPGQHPEILCNPKFAVDKCYLSTSPIYSYTQELTVPYVDGGAYQIWFSDQ